MTLLARVGRHVVPGVVCLVMLATCVSASAQVAITTHHNDLNRTGANTNETILNTSNVNVGSFGKLFSRIVDGQIYAQPLYVPGVTIPGHGLHNVIYVVTEHDSVYAFDADDATQWAPLWHVNFGVPVPAPAVHDLVPEVGITSTPVIDLASNTMYVVAETLEGAQTVFRLHALDIASGAEKFGGPTVIHGTVPGTTYDSAGGILTFNPAMQWQRAGLLLMNGAVYIGFGSHQDRQPYHGWLFAYSATTLRQTAILCLSPDSDPGGYWQGANGAGLWQGGVGLTADAGGNIYVQTGHGPLFARDFGISLVKISTAGGGLAVVDYFSPSNREALSVADIDFGSSAPILIPGTSRVIGGGKDGKLFLLDTNNLGGFHATDQVIQRWQGTASLFDTGDGGFFAGNVFYNSKLYTWGRFDRLKAWDFNGTTFNSTTPRMGTITVPDGYSNEPSLSLSADGTAPGTGILWAAYSADGHADGYQHPGVFQAFDAADVGHELWSSGQNNARDYPGSVGKWSPPTVVNGKVYLATFDGALNVYGLLPPSPGTGSLNVVADSSQAAVNLTADGNTDWVHWGDATLNRKSGVAAQISDFTALGVGSTIRYTNDPRPMNWTDGAPAAASSDNGNGLYMPGTVTGYVVTAPADTTPRTLMLHVGGWQTGGVLTARLSDGSATDFVDTVPDGAPGQYDRNYTLAYAAANPGQQLTVNWERSCRECSGNVTISGAALAITSVTGTITATSGTPQSAIVGTPFSASLRVTVLDTFSSPVVGAFVTFTAPAIGASATFGGSTTTTVVTNSSGQATAPAPTANGVAGSYGVTASAVGASAVFSLTNTGLSLTATSGTPQSTPAFTTFGSRLQATLQDGSHQPMSGVTVTFTAPATGASATFSGAAVATAVTNSSGIATSPALTANGLTGTYTVTAGLTGASVNFSLTNTASTGSGGGLAGAVTTSAAAASLTNEGPADWVHWGDATINRKSGTTAQISNYTLVGGATAVVYVNDPRPLSWTDGAPTVSSAANKNGLYATGNGKGFSITAPADPTSRTLTVHVGGWKSGGRLTAHVSDGSSVDFVDGVDTAATEAGQYDRNYTLAYAASNAGQTLKVTWVMTTASGNVTLDGAALAFAVTGRVTATGGTPQSAVTGTAFASALQATVLNSSSQPVSGVTVTFAAPASGASATFGGAATTTAVTDSNGLATAPIPTANGVTGTYSVTASVTDVPTPATFSLSNTPIPLVTATGGTPQSTMAGTVFGSGLQVTVLDSTNQPMSGAAVTFTAPVSGASATFGGSAAATVVTNGIGVATVPAPTANGVAGSYSVTATAVGASTPAVFSLTNTPIPQLTATGGTPQSTPVLTTFGSRLQATVLNGSNQPMSGVTVTFTAPGSGASATFGGAAVATAVTSSGGIATSPALAANGLTGSYIVTAGVSGVATPSVSFSLTNTAASSGSGGTLAGAVTTSAADASLTAEGPTDWVHWGDTTINRKSGPARISNYTLVGGATAVAYANDPRALSWTDGAPTVSSAANRNGLYVAGTGKGFSLMAPADPTLRTLTVHVGGWKSGGTLTAHLSDGSSVDFVDTSATAPGQYDRNYTFTYTASSAGQTLKVTWVMATGSPGNVTLNGAALAIH